MAELPEFPHDDSQESHPGLPGGPPIEPDQTMAMGVENIGFMLERLGADCDDLQYLREITKNALEAEATKIVWDVDWMLFKMNGVYKLCCIDNGRGMSGPEMVQHINNLSSSGRVQAMDANYGVGAKISAATRNPAGVLYQSWQNGKGSMIQLWRDPKTGEYGLKQFRLADGAYAYVVPISDAFKPDQIEQHGTKVTLLGTDDDADTVSPPDGVPTPSRWFNRYLNGRYFAFPDNVAVRAREGWTYDVEDTDRNVLRRVRGMATFLDEHTEEKGIVELTDCRVRWWILDESEKRRKTSELPNNGHFGALYQDELYELITGRAGTARLQQFGILFGPDRVVLYVEPRNGPKRNLSANTARTQLLLNGQGLPYHDWAVEFRAAMPPELREYMDAVIAGNAGADHSDSILKRLKSYVKLYRLSRYRPKAGGPVRITEASEPGKRKSERDPSEEARTRASKPRSPGSATGDMLAAMVAEEGTEAQPTRPSEPPIPGVAWISDEAILDDRAAKYLPDDNLIQANKDFRVFTDMANYWAAEYGITDPQKGVVDEIVREWFEQALVETVLGAQALQGERRWSPKDIEAILSQEALTAAVMQRYHVANAIHRAMGAKFGHQAKREAA